MGRILLSRGLEAHNLMYHEYGRKTLINEFKKLAKDQEIERYDNNGVKGKHYMCRLLN